MAQSIIPLLYFLTRNISFSSWHRVSLDAGSLQIMLMRMASEYGKFENISVGWQLEVNKY